MNEIQKEISFPFSRKNHISFFVARYLQEYFLYRNSYQPIANYGQICFGFVRAVQPGDCKRRTSRCY